MHDETAKTLGTPLCAEGGLTIEGDLTIEADLAIEEEPTPAGPRTDRSLDREPIEPCAAGITMVTVRRMTPYRTHTQLTVIGPGALFPECGPYRA